ncbi:MAG: tetratricopeptide repeat protein [Acidobacteria bacterium]|nr:tetratricopeptide repeat protein [Acidobacteriota bacterium]
MTSTASSVILPASTRGDAIASFGEPRLSATREDGPITRVTQPTKHPLADQVIVFTGKLSSLGRKEAQALVIRLGGAAGDEVTTKTTMVVIGAEGFSGHEKSQKLRKAEELKLRVLSENEFCRLAGIQPPEDLKQQYYAQRDLLGMYAGLREDHLRYLQKWGLIRPVMRTNSDTYFSFSDLLVIRQVSAELEGAPFRAIVRALQSARSGQLAFNFRIDAEPARIIKLRRPKPREPVEDRPLTSPMQAPPSLAEEYFLKGSALDADESRHHAAANWYRKALEVDPYLVPALINLANIHYGKDELAEAQALYEHVIGLDPDFFEAHFNLGNIYHDLGRFQEASSCYRTALRLNAQYADAHFYLAITLEKIGHSLEAKPHWRAYQQLSPDGEWVELAREFSE